MKFARIVFLVAGVYGLVVLVPQYFLEAKTGRDFPPPITHPEFFYGFIGVTIAWASSFPLTLEKSSALSPDDDPVSLREGKLRHGRCGSLDTASRFHADAGSSDY